VRRPFVAGNWKMFKNVAEARHLVSELVPGLQGVEGVEKVLCPPFTSLLAVAALLEGTDIGLGAQNMHWETSGAYTGEISPPMVAETCRYVILGHSERRALFGETDLMINRKVKSALSHGLTPIVCIGETLDEYESKKTVDVISSQLNNGLSGTGEYFSGGNIMPLIIAYEPVWAIGSGRPSTANGAALVIGNVIRPNLAKFFGDNAAQVARILYGGSVKSSNAAEFFQEGEIDGALVGGASLKAREFIQIVQAAAR